MRRRAFLAVIAGVATAGCISSTDDPGGEPTETTTPAASLRLLKDELTREYEGTSSETIRITGAAQNDGNQDLTHAEVVATLYDGDGVQLGTTLDYTSSLAVGKKWQFSMSYGPGDDVQQVSDYELQTDVRVAE